MSTTEGTGDPANCLALALERARASLTVSVVINQEVIQRIELVARSPRNRACIRFLLACALAKTINPNVDIRKPYTEIGTPDAYSGRVYDERFIGPFVRSYALDCNTTTAFLTPAFRNITTMLVPGMVMAGNAPEVYEAALQLLTDMQEAYI